MTDEPRVVVVDDDDAIRKSLKALLESAELSVTVYDSGRNFLNAYDRHSVACMLLDIKLPDMDGLALQKKLISEGIDFPIIIMTGYGDVPMAVKAMKAGAVDFIEKPFDREALLESVRNALKLARQPRNSRSASEDMMAKIELLTPRQREVLDQLVMGHSNKRIATELGISIRTVENHRAGVMETMQARGVSQLIRMALASGINPEWD